MLKAIRGFESEYAATLCGRIWSYRLGRWLKLTPRYDGYIQVNLNMGGRKWSKAVHQLVALAFLPNPNAKPTVNHKNGKRNDNRVANLEWATVKEQARHRYKTLKCVNTWLTGENSPNSKLTEDAVRRIRAAGAWYGACEFWAKELKVSPSNIAFVLKGKTWRHVK